MGLGYRERPSGPAYRPHGSCAEWFDGSVYALKGNDSPELWRYAPSANSWEELDEAPTDIGGGGALALGDSAPGGERYFYALKGNQFGDFRQYRLAPSGIAGDAEPAKALQMRVAPNPVAGGSARLRYAFSRPGLVRLDVFDVAGRSRWSSEEGFSKSGEVHLDLRGLESGVFLLKCAEGGNISTERFVVLR